VFEIGNSLREARLRQGLDLNDAEQATKIRTKYLGALEDERFELLPAQTYVKGFLRSYAEFLGLDGQIYVDEYNSRFFTVDDEPPLRPRRSPRTPSANRRVESSVLIFALAGIAAVFALVIVAFRWDDGPETDRIPNLDAIPPATTEQTSSQDAPPPQNAWIALVLSAPRGDSSLAVRRGGSTGKILFTGTLERGKAQRFVGPRLWLNIGAPGNLVATLDGKRVALGVDRSAPAVVVATAQGFAPAAAG
jgi:hypothetical protein